MKIVTTVAATDDLVTVDEVKSHSRIDTTADDTLLEGYIQAATDLVEQETGRHFAGRTVAISFDDWPDCDVLKLPVYPLQSVTNVKYKDKDGNLQTMSSDDYVVDLDSVMPRIALAESASWPSATLYPLSAVVVTAVTGHADINDAPQIARQAVMLMVGQWYENREDQMPTYLKEMPLGIKRLLWSIKVDL